MWGRRRRRIGLRVNFIHHLIGRFSSNISHSNLILSKVLISICVVLLYQCYLPNCRYVPIHIAASLYTVDHQFLWFIYKVLMESFVNKPPFYW